MAFMRRAKSRYSVHSPYLYQLVDKVISPGAPLAICSPVEELRKRLLKDHQQILKTDYGAGGNGQGPHEYHVRVNALARHSSLPPKRASRMFKLVRFLGAKQILELGTSLGISAAYMAKADPQARMMTLEGCPALAGMARQHFRELGLENVSVLQGDFDRVLPEALDIITRPDLVFVDGNHMYHPTVRYFREIIELSHENTMFVIDDIHYSPGMEAAWEEIVAHPGVTVTVDLFHQGWVLLKKELSSQHFILRYP